ncbi:2-C-methyl-D-erythritol 2,4-cyclodiphosphate synthase [Teredinibacter turnerae]|uniref:2-C-methyl-D-erythritol 2,4-cyclodiphosphate synthase n=1 Tax=Teredinibacter turnerae TaxID=2426 RepID=UPI0005F7CB96|nr:2-C-methyl-D-erythritol 2,4-cyclodiphosphate synthase [Teredinibacter turnerae]
MRIGHGIVCAQRTQSTKLVLGGVYLEPGFGLAIMNDGDLLLAAVGDALAGASGLGNFVSLYDLTSPDFKHASTRSLLLMLATSLRSKGLRAVNLDISLCGRDLTFNAYRDDMQASIADALGIDATRINLKLSGALLLPARNDSDVLALATALLDDEH